MAYEILSNSSLSKQTLAGPSVTSYDSGYEHSIDHYVDLKLLVDAADKKANSAPATLAAA